MRNSTVLLKQYVSHFIHHFGIRSPETAYMMGQYDSQRTKNIMIEDVYTATGHMRNPIGYLELSSSVFGENHIGTITLKDWISANPTISGNYIEFDEMLVVYAIGRIGLVGEHTKQDLIQLLPKK